MTLDTLAGASARRLRRRERLEGRQGEEGWPGEDAGLALLPGGPRRAGEGDADLAGGLRGVGPHQRGRP